jgi:tetratricopeptide (TPR) repeat protein
VYLVYLALGIAFVAGVGIWFATSSWLLGIFLGLVAMVAVWIVGARRLNRRLMPAMQAVQRQVQAGHVLPAIATLEEILPFGKWMPLLEGQIHAQIGVLAYNVKQREKAIEHLQKSSRRAAEARMLLATIRYRDDKIEEALQILREAGPFNRKNVLLHNFHAWLLYKEKRPDDAMAVLNRLLSVYVDDSTKDNLQRIQNGKKMNMKAFGLPWFMLGFERPPQQMMQQPPGQMRGRKGMQQMMRGGGKKKSR